jgi:RND family efflux transporter MFP subunit
MKKIVYLNALLAMALLGACSGGKSNSETLERKEEKPLVKLESVSARDVDQLQEYTATVEADVKNDIAPQSPVRIDKILVEVGDRVSKGQRVVLMDQTSLEQQRLLVQNQKADFQRTDEVYKVGGISKSDWEAAKSALDRNEVALKNLEENASLISPITGIVSARNYDNGDLYNGQTPILVVQQIEPVKLKINVSETSFTKVKKNDPVSVKLDVYPGETFTGRIHIIYPTIDEATRTFPVEIRLDNKDHRIRPGMFARATLNFGTMKHVVVPDISIVKQAGSGDRYIYVYKDGKVKYNKVELGQRLDAEYELISGVEDQAQVVVAGQSRLLDNMEVTVAK